jgi:hypothetical protein
MGKPPSREAFPVQQSIRATLAIRLVAGAVCALTLLSPLAAAGPLEGRWILTEQSYGEGRTDLASGEPLVLELYRQGERTEGRILAGEAASGAAPQAHTWPIWIAEGRVLPGRILEREIDPALGVVRARYEVKPSEGDDLVLEVQEEYLLEEGGSALVGTVKIQFRAGDEARGGYTLHRRFERSR